MRNIFKITYRMLNIWFVHSISLSSFFFYSLLYIIFLSTSRTSLLLKLFTNSSHLEMTEIGRIHFIFSQDFKKSYFRFIPKFFTNNKSLEIIIFAFRLYHIRSKNFILFRLVLKA